MLHSWQLKLAAVVAVLVLATFGVMYAQKQMLQAQLETTQHQLEQTENMLKAQVEMTAGLSRQLATERRTARVIERVITQVQASPNAETPVPADLAHIWATSIDSLRNDEGVRGNRGGISELLPP